jgi:hypothetical protein
MVLVTFAGTKVTRVRADARIKSSHAEAILKCLSRSDKKFTFSLPLPLCNSSPA